MKEFLNKLTIAPPGCFMCLNFLSVLERNNALDFPRLDHFLILPAKVYLTANLPTGTRKLTRSPLTGTLGCATGVFCRLIMGK